MTDRQETAVDQRYLLWLVVFHLLPINMVRQLLQVIVHEGSGHTLTLGDLFEELHLDGSTVTGSYAIRPKATEDAVAGYLSSRVRHLLWQADNEVSVNENELPALAATKARQVELAIRLSRHDLSRADPVNFEIPAYLRDAITAFKALQTLETDTSDAEALSAAEALADNGTLLAALLLKHAGDGLAAYDNWSLARPLYLRSRQLIEQLTSFEEDDDLQPLVAIVNQSIAAADWIVKAPAAAAEALKEEPPYPAQHLTWALNSSPDALISSEEARDDFGFGPDRRGFLYQSPLLLSSLSPAAALVALEEKRYFDANQRFRTLLRRRTALGSTAESRSAKALFALSLLEEMNDEDTRNTSNFLFCARLILESGNRSLAAQMRWHSEIVRDHVSREAFGMLIDWANRYAGDRSRRNAVLAELVAGWLQVLPVEELNVATTLMAYLVPDEETWADRKQQSAMNRRLKLLNKIADARPEFRDSVSHDVTRLVVTSLKKGLSVDRVSDVFTLANEFISATDEQDLRDMVSAVVALLDGLDPASGEAPITGPAIDYLTSNHVKSFLERNPDLRGRVVENIIRFGTEQKSEHVRLLYLLGSFDELNVNLDLSDRLAPVIAHVIERAQKINSSDANANIITLLSAPHVVGQEGLAAAFRSLSTILSGALSGGARLSFPAAFQGIRQAVLSMEDITAIFASDKTPSHPASDLFELLLRVWDKAGSDPLMFTDFAIPRPTRINTVLVHNWSLVSMQLAHSLDRDKEMRDALARAAKNSDLREALDWGQTSWHLSPDREDAEVSAEMLASQSGLNFYNSIGQHLAHLRKLDAEQKRPLLESMVRQCLKHGPKEVDAAVLSQLKVMPDTIPLAAIRDYLKRTDRPGAVRLVIRPLLYELCGSMELDW